MVVDKQQQHPEAAPRSRGSGSGDTASSEQEDLMSLDPALVLSKKSTSSFRTTNSNNAQSKLQSFSVRFVEEEEEEDSTDGSEGSFADDAANGKSGGGARELNVAKTETQQLQKLRFIVVIVLFFAVACAVGVYFYVRNQERANFEVQFHEDAVKIMGSLSHTLENAVGGINALSVSLVSHATATNQTWPFVVVPDYGVRAGKFLSLSKAYVINTYMYVEPEQRAEWESYTSGNNGWVNKTIDIQEANNQYQGPIVRNYTIWDVIFDYGEYDKPNPGEFGTNRTGPYFLPWWQSVPIIPLAIPPYNWDLMSWGTPDITSVVETHKISLSYAYMITYGNDTAEDELNEAEAEFVQNFIDPSENPVEPVSDILYPIIAESAESFNLWDDNQRGEYNTEDYTFAGMVAMSFYWRDMIRNILAPGSDGIVIVFSNPGCNPTFSYMFNGPEVLYLGTDDYSDPAYDNLAYDSLLLDLTEYALRDSGYSGAPFNQDYCPFRVKVAPSHVMEQDYMTSNPIIFSVTAGVIFLAFALIFSLYDAWVERRQRLVMDRASRTEAIVSNLFPQSITNRLIKEAGSTKAENAAARASDDLDSSNHRIKKMASFMSPKRRVKNFLNNLDRSSVVIDKPIADLFPYTTIMICDIIGFEAWVSSRDPAQVFILLEKVFKAFDHAAKRRHVFKVETVADRYVAVTGLPDPQTQHAVIMARFAWDCLTKFAQMCSKLEAELGPDTSTLGLRVGMHSGPVTAGVLRVDRTRFQLFGDTVNAAARIERAGQRNRIHVSHATAKYLFSAGKRGWLTQRQGPIAGDSRGMETTYWLVPKHDDANSIVSLTSHLYEELPDELGVGTAQKRERLVDWMAQLLQEHIKAVIAQQEAIQVVRQPQNEIVFKRRAGKTCLDEVKDVIVLPKFNAQAIVEDSTEVEIPQVVVEQLHSLVSILASTYRENHFHNFEHACQVTLCVDKYIKRIVSADIGEAEQSTRNLASALHDYTHGINSDPLTILAIVFSALIHDSDHRGVSNAQLCKEEEQMANAYRNQSVAEQNSLDISWDVLMDDEFSDLRACIFANQDDLLRFRQVVVNVVLATDIFDKELNDLRKKRWNRAFSSDESMELNEEDFGATRATIVIEHIIQGADVAHTMQHWDIYRRWNEKLFAEMTEAFRAGRMGKDPATFWYKGEIGFFDNYIIPLAKKLKECNVFGVSSDECLNYAEKNRREWELYGQDIVAQLVKKYAAGAPKDTGGTAPDTEIVEI